MRVYEHNALLIRNKYEMPIKATFDKILIFIKTSLINNYFIIFGIKLHNCDMKTKFEIIEDYLK